MTKEIKIISTKKRRNPKKEKEQLLFEYQKLKNKETSVNKSNENYEDQRNEYYSARFLG